MSIEHFTFSIDAAIDRLRDTDISAFGAKESDKPEIEKVLRRIFACVNACAGIDTDLLEDGIIGKLRDDRDLLLQQRDDLQAKYSDLILVAAKAARHLRPTCYQLFAEIESEITKAQGVKP